MSSGAGFALSDFGNPVKTRGPASDGTAKMFFFVVDMVPCEGSLKGSYRDKADVDGLRPTVLLLLRRVRTGEMPHQTPKSMTDELGAWNNGAGIPLETWTGNEGNYKLTVGYAALLWPRFEAVDKYILVEGVSKENIEGLENQVGSTPKGVEWVLNHWHLADLHYHDDDNLSADKLLFIGNIVKEMWEAKLQTQFPDRPCTVEFRIPEDPEELWEYQISFWQTAWDTDGEE